ncbi:MAG: hypothetical protein KAI99_05230 [Cyclobacteriaceae bacterium]|nr:hypothetical protein [Cyclobacteriaceae bacterium]
MVKDENIILEIILKKNDILEVEEKLLQDLIEIIREDTLGYKVTTALNQRKQGHFDKVMLNISEVNRDQVLSIRAIQSIIDKIKGTSKTEVIFGKFRQFYPLQIGLKNGKDVLELLSLIRLKCGFSLEEFVADLHKNEGMFDSLQQELNFYETRMKGRTSENEINELKNNIENTTERIFEIKTSIVDCICGVVQANHSQISVTDRISLVKNIYLILSSSIQTLDAEFVEVEQNT